MESIEIARENCASVLTNFYPELGLLADMLGDNGEYRGFWQTPRGTVVEAKSDDIFDEQGFTCLYELEYKQTGYGWPTAS